MTTLFKAINEQGTTGNGCVTNLSSLNRNVDLFFMIGASRGKDIIPAFVSALVEDFEVATRTLQYSRDIRGGQGERETFRKLFAYLLKNEPALASRLLVKIPVLGRWDDLFVAFGTPMEREALRMIAHALNVDKDGLCAKWQDRKGPNANKVRAYLKLTPKEYRKLIVELSCTVETQMCAQEWNAITYSHVPSVAAGRYQKAFLKHDPIGYGVYKEKLTSGEEKINASAVYPYDVIRSLKNGDKDVANAQWNSLPDYLNGSTENILPVVDVSGSMTCKASGSVTCLDVAISLGLYVSERNNGIFKDQFITFSNTPQMLHLTGNLHQKYDQMNQSDWKMTTDVQKVFELILNSAVKNKISENEMPKTILILSDMNFNQCARTGSTPASVSAFEFIDKSYIDAGYQRPQIVFWNLNASAGNVPVTYDVTGTALVSGFSPSIMKSVLGGENLTPISVMLKTVMIQRYDF